MIRSELIQKLADENPGLTLPEVERIVDLFFKEIVDRLASGGRVELRGFGAFTTRARDARTGRNPRTGEQVPVSAKRVPFASSKTWSKLLKSRHAMINVSRGT